MAKALAELSYRIRCRRRFLEEVGIDADLQLWLFDAECLLDEWIYS